MAAESASRKLPHVKLWRWVHVTDMTVCDQTYSTSMCVHRAPPTVILRALSSQPRQMSSGRCLSAESTERFPGCTLELRWKYSTSEDVTRYGQTAGHSTTSGPTTPVAPGQSRCRHYRLRCLVDCIAVVDCDPPGRRHRPRRLRSRSVPDSVRSSGCYWTRMVNDTGASLLRICTSREDITVLARS